MWLISKTHTQKKRVGKRKWLFNYPPPKVRLNLFIFFFFHLCSEFCTYRIHWMEGNSSRFSLTAPFTTTSRASEIHSLGSARCFFVSCDILEFFCRCKKFFCSICRDGHNAGGPYMPNEGWEDGKGDGAERICFFFSPFFGAALYPSDSS